jgi:hypothetical protein
MAAELMQGWVTLSATIARVRLNTNISRNNLYILQSKRSTPLLKARQCLLLPTQGLLAFLVKYRKSQRETL